MNEPRDFASLSPGLLARKGGAKPAMRPQDTSRFTAGGIPIDPSRLDDLGWNDFGPDIVHEPAVAAPGAVRSVQFPTGALKEAKAEGGSAAGRDLPEVLRQIEDIAARISPRAAADTASARARRVAFTLRLERDRHLRLKMAGVVLGRSAQSIVTEALDRYLAEIPELSALAAASRRPS
jgi:hypothetical protein